MCGRYTLYSEKKIKSKFNVKIIKNFNISPRQNVLIVNENFSPIFCKWGISSNWNGKKHTIINARHETLNSKTIFKDLRRCIFVADGYYEWKKEHNSKNPFYLINTSRGKCLKTSDLVKGLKSGKILGACLDVIENESKSFEEINSNSDLDYLKNSKNVIITPHIAGWTYESKVNLSKVILEKIKHMFDL